MQPERTTFAPKSTQETSVATPPQSQTDKPTKDGTSQLLIKIARYALVAYAGLLPVFFMAGLWGSLGFQKVILSIGLIGVVVILLSLLALRTQSVVTVAPLSIALSGGVALSAVLSGLFSPDWQGAFRGSFMETQTVSFLAILTGVMLSGLILQQTKKAAYQVLVALLGGTALVLMYIVLRLLFGPILAFGSFGSSTVSPIGNFNDMAVFAALGVILSLVVLVQLQARLKTASQAIFTSVVVLALVVLAAVNFFYVWLVVGFFALLMVLYLISQDTLFSSEADGQSAAQPAISRITLGIAVAVCLVSGVFIVAGDFAGGYVSRALDVDFLEVRPSLGATTDILQSTYREDILLGAGPNQFISSWREYKDPSINQTIFWNTDFQAGSGYVPTMFINLGVLGALLFIGFHVWYLWSGLKMLLRPSAVDPFWYLAAAVTFAGAVFLWGMSYVYVPGAMLLLLAALLTGISLAAGRSLQPERAITIKLATNRQRGFALMAVAIVCITGAMGTWFTVGKQYVAQASFNEAESQATDLAALDQAALASYALYPDDRFLDVRARVALLEMNQLLSIVEPTESDQQRFLEASDRALIFAEQAIAQAPHEPSYYALRAGVFNNLAIAGIPTAVERATSSVAEAVALDPQNPSYPLLLAQMAANRGDVAAAREALLVALTQKNNFNEALFLLAQIEIAEGNVEQAIATTEAIIRLEPNNPTRYYQLGILESSNGNTERAKQAHQAALNLDPDFANARYLLALIQISEGETDEALRSLRLVAANNAENQQLQELITALEAGEVPVIQNASDAQVNESAPISGEDVVTSPVAPESDLLTPLNTVGSAGAEESESTNVQNQDESESETADSNETEDTTTDAQ